MGTLTKKEQLGMEILQNCRTELYFYFPHLDGAFASVRYEPESRSGIRTDGEGFFFSGEDLVSGYVQDQKRVVRGYLHMLLHCLYLHPWMEAEKESRLWNLACDLFVEALIEKENREELQIVQGTLTKEVLKGLCRRTLYVPEIFHMLKEKDYPEAKLEELEADTFFDEHLLWMETDEQEKGRMRRKWQHIREFSSERKSKGAAFGSEAGEDSEVLDDYTKSRYDYRRFLKQFSVLREEVELDLESFDYIFYNLGMEMYQDMPLIEPLEYKEVNRLEELVIAIDTSSSCTTEIVQQFLAETIQMLSQKENFFRKMKVFIIQCDTHIEDVAVIHSMEEWKAYCKKITIYGRGGTDFRPVFRLVEELQEKKEILNLKGLIYFTDGDGVFPKEKPSYETAFVLLKEKAKLDYVPEWAQILLI